MAAADITSVVILAGDWLSGCDPVPYHASNDDRCLDLNSSNKKPRAVLSNPSPGVMADCEHQIDYHVYVCQVGR